MLFLVIINDSRAFAFAMAFCWLPDFSDPTDELLNCMISKVEAIPAVN